MNGPQPVSGAQAKRLAITVPVATAVLAFAANLSGNAPEVNMPRVLAGTVILMVILALLAEGAPSIAAGFAWVILVTAFFVTGEPAWRALANLTGGAGNGPTSSSPGSRAASAARGQAGRAVAGAMQNIPTKSERTDMGDKFANILGGILTIALVTTVVLPNRQSAKVIDAFGDAFSGAIRASLGK